MDFDTFKSIETFSEGFYKEKNSKFLAFAYPLNTKEEAQAIVKKLKKQYFDAKHHCYAYVIGQDKSVFRANDDGEPSGTAGKPILNQLYSFEVTNILLVVVRYFGGTLLGTSGLINAYKSASKEALTNANIIEKPIKIEISLTTNFEKYSELMRFVKKMNLEIIKNDFVLPNYELIISVKKSKFSQIKESLKDFEL